MVNITTKSVIVKIIRYWVRKKKKIKVKLKDMYK